tara:strand:- start:485 stop:1066 length:582 start_codon:yes stop_codon:yes gene_type:complete
MLTSLYNFLSSILNIFNDTKEKLNYKNNSSKTIDPTINPYDVNQIKECAPKITRSLLIENQKTIFNNNSNNYFYYLSLIKNDNDDWSIHGLWPQYDSKSYPIFCTNTKFVYSNLEPILIDLNKYWYSTKGKNEDFWKHEWEKHGTCMFKKMTELEYFELTLKLYHKAIESDIPGKFSDGKKSMIPVNQNFEFI